MVPAEEFFIGPRSRHHAHDRECSPSEMLTAIRYPQDLGRRAVLFREGRRPQRLGLPAGQRRCGNQGDANGMMQDARVACGGVSCAPRRLAAVEETIKGKKVDKSSPNSPAIGNRAAHGR